MAVVQGGDDLPEEVPCLALAEPLPLADVVIQVAPAGVLHDDHNLAAVLKHWGRTRWDIRPLRSTQLPLGGPGLFWPWTRHLPPGCLLMGQEGGSEGRRASEALNTFQ